MNTTTQNTEVQVLRELNLAELEDVSGGLKWSCTGGYNTEKGASIGCTIGGSF